MSEWFRVGDVAVFADRDRVPIKLGERRLILYRVGNGVFATDRRCTHQGADLMRGYFEGRTIECPVHQGRFDICSGAALNAPASEPLKTYAVRVLDGQIEIQI